MSQFYTLTVSEIQKETENAVTITFHLPDYLQSTFTFKAGQYITLKTTINDKEIRRDYSLCVAPNSKQLKVAVKAIENGTFSVYANTQLKKGDTLEVSIPKGRFIFTPNQNSTNNLVLVAAGSGITPILSILKCALQEETKSNVILIYGNKTPNETMFLEELLELQQNYFNRFSMQLVFSKAEEKEAIFGRIEKSTFNFVLKNKHKNTIIDAYYLCGPEGMIQTLQHVLEEENVSPSKIYYELFKATPSSNSTTIATGATKITIVLDEEDTTYQMPQSETILEAALKKDLDVPYSCQGGICSSCIAKVTKGKASMRQNNILTEKEVEEGLILTCQAQPITAEIEVDYDAV